MIKKTLREILSEPDKLPEGWLYLPPVEWTLDTVGVFSGNSAEYEPESNEYIPVEAREQGWLEVLDNQSIEDVVENLKQQLRAPSLDQFLGAMIFYYQNDAFLVID